MARGSWHEAAVVGVRCAEIARRAGRLVDAATQLSGAAAIQGAARRLALGAVEGGGPTEEQPELRRDERPGTGPGLIIGLRRECTRQLAASLGQDRLAEMRAIGEATDIDEVVRRTLALIEDLLDVPASVQPIGQPAAREWENRRA